MSNQEIIFYDLPSKGHIRSWSLNTWKIRFALNYKGVPYKTEWIEYPDIKPTFQDHVPKADLYTVPTVTFPDGTWVTESIEIAKVLDERYPEKNLRLDSPYLPKISAIFSDLAGIIPVIYLPLIFSRLVSEGSQEHFRSTREKAFGMSMEEFAKLGGEEVWKKSEPHWVKATALLKENPEGPFFEGKTVGYVDFVWAGILVGTQRIGDDLFQQLLKHIGDADVHLKLLEGVKPWSERDDY